LASWLLGRLCGGLCFGGSAHLNLNKSGFVAYLQIGFELLGQYR
jgi:hypothetical protein